jgi:glycosyltransferase involved in cell wall biosynthesis
VANAPATPSRRLTVLQALPALEGGGVERGTVEMVKALVQAGHRALVVSAGGQLVDRLKLEGGEHYRLPIGEKSFGTLLLARDLKRFLKTEQVDLVHARSRMPAWVCWLALKLTARADRPAFVTTLHGLNSVGAYSGIMTRGDKVIAVSNAARDYWTKHYGRLNDGRLAVIQRGVNRDEFPFGYQPAPGWAEQFRSMHGPQRDRKLILQPARITRRKGHERALKLLKELVDRGFNAELLIVGAHDRQRSSYRQELKTLATSLNVERRVSWLGHRSDMRELYAVCDLVLALSTQPEAFGRIAVEALAIGKPVLGYDHGGIGEILREIYPAGLAPPNSSKALIERAVALLREPPPVPNVRPYDKAELLAQEIALYERLCSG